MARFEKRNITIYDEPISYSKFTGGINNSPSNENLSDIELRDATNWHYNGTDLERRLGGKILMSLSNIDSMVARPDYIQGTFVYGIGDNTYLIAVVDGKIFYVLIDEDILDIRSEGGASNPLPIELSITIPDSKIDDTGIGGGAINITGQPDNECEGLPKYQLPEKPVGINHDGYILMSTINVLMLQNYKLVEGIGINDEFRLASGTRLIVIKEETSGVLKAEIATPKKPNGWEYSNIGLNNLSPYPDQYIKNHYDAVDARINAVLAGDIEKAYDSTGLEFEAIMEYPTGKDSQDYYFKWEGMLIDSADKPKTGWFTLITSGATRTYTEANSKGLSKLDNFDMSSITIDTPASGDKLRIRCSFAESFEKVEALNTTTGEIDVKTITETCSDAAGLEYEDSKPDAVNEFGATYVTLQLKDSGYVSEFKPNQTFLNIHSCRKIIADGAAVMVYDDYMKSGSWYKAVIEDYNYISDKGNLNFQTNKNEALIRAIGFEGNIVCFSYNEEIGGNIAVVTGSGDDYDAKDGYFSPYRRKIANTNITADHPNTIQIIENNLIFKYRDTVYTIHSKELDSDRVDVVSVNDKLKHFSWLEDNKDTFDLETAQMPNLMNNALFEGIYKDDYERRVYSEVTEDYFALIYPAQNLRWKMYFKLPVRYDGDPKTYYPWLRDTSSGAFKVASTLKLKGVSTLLTTNFDLIQFTDTNFLDLGGDTFSSKVVTKAFDLGYSKFMKYLNNLNVYYYRDYSKEFTLNVELRNEADHDIYGLAYKASHEYAEDDGRKTTIDRIIYKGAQPIDQKLLVADESELDMSVLGPEPKYVSKVFTPIYMLPFLSISVKIEIEDAASVTISSLGFDFTSAQLPDGTPQNYYKDIIKF